MKIAFSPIQTNYNHKNKSKQQVGFSGTPEILENLAKGLHESQLSFHPNTQRKAYSLGGANAFLEAAASDRAFPAFLEKVLKFRLYKQKIKTLKGNPSLLQIINKPKPADPVTKLDIKKEDTFFRFANDLMYTVKTKVEDPLSHLYGNKEANGQLWSILTRLEPKKQNNFTRITIF